VSVFICFPMHILFQEMRHSILLKAKCETVITVVSKWSKLEILPDSDLENIKVTWKVR